MTLLFIEDEIYTRTGILESVDWDMLGITRVETANDGKSGFSKLAIRPDIVLTDIRMPYQSGLEIAAKAKKNDPDCEIIILSSHSDKEYLMTAISLSTVAYIEKPVDIAELSHAITQAVRRRRQSARLRRIDGAETPSSAVLLALLKQSSGYSHPTQMMIRYLEGHYPDADLLVENIAECVHLSPIYASALFKEETGLGLKRTITDIRMEEACSLLNATNLPIAELAEKVGYHGANYFAKLFKKEMGMTPIEYRESRGTGV